MQEGGNSKELAVVGSKTFITGFALAGVRDSLEATSANARTLISTLLTSNTLRPPAILIIEEEILVEFSRKEKEKLLEMMRPIVMFVSGKQEITLQSSIKRALGIDILLNKNIK